jgi:HEAT repeat protein
MSKMKMTIRTSFVFLLTISLFAQDGGNLVSQLKSDDAATAVSAANSLGRKKEAAAINPLIEAAKNHPSFKVRAAAASALGNMEAKPNLIKALKGIIESDKNNAVVYSALVAIFNLKDFSNKDALGAVEYCEKNKMDDVFIKDIISKIRKAM